MLGPVLEGAHVRLEPPVAEHLALLARWYADPVVTRELPSRFPLRFNERWLDELALNHTDIMWVMVAKQSGAPVGAMSLYAINWQHRHAWIGALVGERPYWGQGQATEAGRLIADFAFLELGFEKLILQTATGNGAARRVAEKIGFRQSGVLRHHRFFEGRWHDDWLGELLREDHARRPRGRRQSPALGD